MANAVYPFYKQSLLSADTFVSLNQNSTSDGPYCSLVDTGVYTYSSTNQFYAALSGAIVGTDQRITSPTVALGTFDGGDLTYTAVSGNTVEALVITRYSTASSSLYRLVLYLDTSVTGLPVTPNGGDITVTWNGSGIFTL